MFERINRLESYIKKLYCRLTKLENNPSSFILGITDEFDASNGVLSVVPETNTIAFLSDYFEVNASPTTGIGVVTLSDAFLTSVTNYWAIDVNGNIQNTNLNGSVFSRGGGNVITNTAYGENALKLNTTGEESTAFGYNALANDASIGFNSAFGSSALESNTGGFANDAFGDWTLKDMTNGYYNSAFGNGAMRFTLGGFGNCAFGASSMRFLQGTGTSGGQSQVGSRNAAFGVTSLLNITTGWANSAFGADSLKSVTTGQRNIGVGQQAGSAISTGSGNVVVATTGFTGVSGITTGNNNMILAPNNGNATGITTGSGNIIIGKVTGLVAGLNETMIFATGGGIERFRVSDIGNMGIGTNNPNSTSILDVVSTTKTLTIPRMNNAQQGAVVSPLAGSMIYNNQNFNNNGSFQLRDNQGWFGVRRKDIVDMFIAANVVIATNTSRTVATGGIQGFGGGTLTVNSNTSNSFNVATGQYTNNTGEIVTGIASGTFSFASAAWTAGQTVEISLAGLFFKRAYAPTTGTYIWTIDFSIPFYLPNANTITINIVQFSGSNKTITPVFSRISMIMN